MKPSADCSREEVAGAVQDANAVIIDCRTPGETAGMVTGAQELVGSPALGPMRSAVAGSRQVLLPYCRSGNRGAGGETASRQGLRLRLQRRCLRVTRGPLIEAARSLLPAPPPWRRPPVPRLPGRLRAGAEGRLYRCRGRPGRMRCSERPDSWGRRGPRPPSIQKKTSARLSTPCTSGQPACGAAGQRRGPAPTGCRGKADWWRGPRVGSVSSPIPLIDSRWPGWPRRRPRCQAPRGRPPGSAPNGSRCP